jgi:hypothetical protein
VKIYTRGGFSRRKRGAGLKGGIRSNNEVVKRNSVNSVGTVKMATQIVNKQEKASD